VLVLGFPGSGYAEKPDRRCDLACYEGVALAFLDALGAERVPQELAAELEDFLMRPADQLP
jgi:hypothetical protein